MDAKAIHTIIITHTVYYGDFKLVIDK